MFKNIICTYTNWRASLSTNSRFKMKAILLPFVFWIYSFITQSIGIYVENRQGIQLHNKILFKFPNMDFSFGIFLLLYTCMAAIIINNLRNPYKIIMIAEMHLYVAIVRQICILLLPLEAPLGIIPLQDILLENTFYPTGAPLTKDLFFSGHVASIWIYFLCASNKKLQFLFFIATILMSFMVLSMRIHYTYDVVGAIIFTTLIYTVHNYNFERRHAKDQLALL